MPNQTKWVKDDKVAFNLKAMGIKFTQESVRLADIDLEEGLRRQVRLGKKLDETVVVEMATAMEKGSPFPMPVLNFCRHKLPSGKKYFSWSGNHRLASGELYGTEMVDAYIVDVLGDPMTADFLPRVVNAWEGRRSTREEMLINAAYMVERHGLVAKDVAAEFGLKYEWLAKHIQGTELTQKVIAVGVSPNGLSRTTILRMAPLASNSNVLRETARFLCKNKISGDEAFAVIDSVKSADTELSQLAELSKWERIMDERRKALEKPKKTKGTPAIFKTANRAKVILGVQRLAKILDGIDTIQQAQLTDPADQQIVKKHYVVIREKMDRLLRGVD